MAVTKHHDEPGSPAWHARRARCFNAGDASAGMGCHPSGKTRTQLLDELCTGVEREFTDYVQERVIDPGHRVEALWRPIAEEIIGEDLQVIGFSLDVGLSRPLGASLDGITFMEDVSGECKSANDALRAALPHTGRDSHTLNDARQLPKGYRVQVEQQQMASGATRTLFSACQFNADGSVAEERHCWYLSDAALRAEILATWKQIDEDRKTHQPKAAGAAPAVVAAPVQALPAVSVVVDGTIAIRHNLPAFEVALRDFLEHRLIRAPKTDQDFADLDVQIKAMKGAEAALESAETNWIAQLDAVATAKRQKDMLLKLTRDNRLMAEKLLASEKERRKGDIVAVGVKGLADHIAALNKRLGKPYMPAIPADFGGCIRGMKSLASMEDKVATELARAKIAASEIADRIEENLRTLRELAQEHSFLFADTAALVLKPVEDCRAQVTSRIAEHRAAEERRLEAERARIRQEEEARAQRQTEERAAADRRQQEAEARDQRQREEDAERERQRQLLGMAQPAAFKEPPVEAAVYVPLSAALPVDNVRQMPTKPQAGPPTLKLGDIQKRIAPVSIDAAGLAVLGFPFAAQAGNAKLYHEHQYAAICDALIAQVARAKLQHLEAA